MVLDSVRAEFFFDVRKMVSDMTTTTQKPNQESLISQSKVMILCIVLIAIICTKVRYF